MVELIKKRVIIFSLIAFLFLTSLPVGAEEINVKSQVLVVSENKLVELSAQQKFDDLIVIMKELVKAELKEDKELKIAEITITDFELVPEQGFKIYYQLD